MFSFKDLIILIYLYLDKFSKYVLPRALFGFIGFLLFSSNTELFTRFIVNGFAPIIGDNYGIAYTISILTLYSIGWISYGFILNASEALGFRNRREISLYRQSTDHPLDSKNVGLENENSGISQKKALSQNVYRRGDPLTAFQSGRNRIQEHIFRLQNNAVINLFTAMTIAIVGILILGSAFFEIEKYHDTDRLSFKIYDFLVIAVIPRLTISLFLQVFSYFFLLMYKSNLTDVRYFQNEMTNMDYHAAAISIAMRNDNSQPQKSAISKLLSVERNRLMSKNQRVISPTEDEKILSKIMEIDRNVKLMDRRSSEN